MAVVPLTKKKRLVGNNVSHSNRKTKREQQVNIQWKRFWLPEQKRWVRLKVSTSALRTIAKNGIESVLREAGLLKLTRKKKKSSNQTAEQAAKKDHDSSTTKGTKKTEAKTKKKTTAKKTEQKKEKEKG